MLQGLRDRLKRLTRLPETEERLFNDTASGTWFTPGIDNPWVTPQNSMTLSAVWACETLIADSIATLPVNTYRKGGTSRVETMPPSWLAQPNPEMARVNYDTSRILSLLGWGNAYTFIQGNPGGYVATRWLLNPDKMQVLRDGTNPGLTKANLVYIYNGNEIPQENLQHIARYPMPGWITGMSVVAEARQSLGIGQSADMFSSNFYKNGITASGALEVPALPPEVNKDVIDRLRESLAERYAGTGNAGKPLVLAGGTKWTQLTMNPVDAQFLETREFQVEEICRWFRVPLHLIQRITGKASQGGGNGLEQMALEFSTMTLRPLVSLIEEADSMLLPRGQYVKYNIDAFVRADLKTRYEAYNTGRMGGWLSANDVRALEDDPPIDNGDIYLQPLNYQEAGAEPPAPPSPSPLLVPSSNGNSVGAHV